jgi:hypothetical protein
MEKLNPIMLSNKLYVVEDFSMFENPNLLCLQKFKIQTLSVVVKIIGIWVPTTKKGLESAFGKVIFENLTPQEVLQFGA